MADSAEMKEEFWDELDDSPTVMLGLVGVDEAHTQPMRAQFDDDYPNKIWFFTNRDNRLLPSLLGNSRAVMTYGAKGHDLFACVHGTLAVETDRSMIEAFWSPTIATWYENGKEDENLVLLRFEPGDGQIWKAGTGVSLHAMFARIFKGSADEVAEENVARVYF